MNKMTTHERLMQKLTIEQKEEYDKEYQELLLSELAFAIKARDEILVKELQRMIVKSSSHQI